MALLETKYNIPPEAKKKGKILEKPQRSLTYGLPLFQKKKNADKTVVPATDEESHAQLQDEVVEGEANGEGVKDQTEK
jgi:hypothetical protein